MARPFALGRYEVTVAEWKACVAGGGCARLPTMKGYTDDTPVYNVHLRRRGGLRGLAGAQDRPELPAAERGRVGVRGPRRHDHRLLVGRQGRREARALPQVRRHGRARDAAHGRQPAGQPLGPGRDERRRARVAGRLLDQELRQGPGRHQPRVVKGCQQHVTRGGSWLDQPDDLTVTARGFYDADVPYLANGFRVARDLE